MGPSEPVNIQIVREFFANIPPFSSEPKNPPGLGPFDAYLWDERLHFSSGREYPDSFDVYLRGKVLNSSISSIDQLLKLSRPNPNEKSPSFLGLLVDNLDLSW
ncbi:PREDICTED: LOC110746828 partial [Prunus dulcis]|uniref:PREDICTED: LOC110746828 partial n=1 Tax=Prunus dulcis TaxID=3755 RepID=A0A5E4G823_PRUDU|nr:PREDICTED: LOC110746828 partial [Prunus dulcis]VVA38970.1 PREDICTED: LOC110746828 partial [Prunus dulcis]